MRFIRFLLGNQIAYIFRSNDNTNYSYKDMQWYIYMCLINSGSVSMQLYKHDWT